MIFELAGAKRREFSGMIHNKLSIIIPATPIPIHSLGKTHNYIQNYNHSFKNYVFIMVLNDF